MGTIPNLTSPRLTAWKTALIEVTGISSLLVPKRYAITSTHLFADGQRYPWERLRLAKRQPKRRIMLLRNGWGPFGPLPLGGDPQSLGVAREYIKAMEQARQPLPSEKEAE